MHRLLWSRLSGPLLFLASLAAVPTALAQSDAAPAAKQASAPLKSEELQALLAPIALYPDPLLAQVLMASTYPLEVVQAARWSKANPKVTGKDLEDAMLKQSWDASVKSLCSFPDTLAMMNDKLDWTQKLGDTFLAQQDDVMAAVQALRTKAQASGNLKSSKELTVTTEAPQPPPADAGVAAQPAAQQVIIIQPANPQVVYVPQYNPVVVYGAWPYPAYPPYPVYPPGYVAATAAISFGVGLAVGAAMWGSCSWGYRGYSSVNINVNNYNRYNHTNINNNRNNSNWNHNASHRHGVPYNNASTQQRYGGNRSAAEAKSRDSFRGREQGGVQNPGGGGGRGQGASAAQRPAGGASNVGQGASPAQRPTGGASNVGQGASPAQRPAGGASNPGQAQRPASGGSQRPAPSQGGMGGGSSGRAGGSAYQGMNNGGQARAASSRGHSSMGGGGGGGRRR